jgi:hypothetical protein
VKKRQEKRREEATYLLQYLPPGKMFCRQAREKVRHTRHRFSFCSLGRF